MSSAVLLLIGVTLGAAVVALSEALIGHARRRRMAAAQESALVEQAQALQEATDARRAVVKAHTERMAGWVTSLPLDKLLHLKDGLHELEFMELRAVLKWWREMATHPEWLRPIGAEDHDQKLQVFYALYQEADLFFTRTANEA